MVFDMLRGQIVETVTKLYDYVEDVPSMQELMQFSTKTHVYTFRIECGGKDWIWGIVGDENLCGAPITQTDERQSQRILNNEVLGPYYNGCEYSFTTANGTCIIKVHAEKGGYPEVKLCKESWLTYVKDEKPPMSGLKRSVLHAKRQCEQLVSVGREKSPY